MRKQWLPRSKHAVTMALLISALLVSTKGYTDTVRFHAWGGSAQVNGYLQWVANQLSDQGITLQHVKLADTSDAVSRVLTEKAAGNTDNGSVDLIWINGENFAAMKKHGLLRQNWVKTIPNFSLTNPAQNPAMKTDFGEPTLGMEAPWGKASMVFYFRKRYLDEYDVSPPTSITSLLSFAKAMPGRFTYPLPSDYLGISFLKYAALALNHEHRDVFYKPASIKALNMITPSLWAYLDTLHPLMWREGDYMVRQASQLQRLVGNGELALSFSFTAAEIPSAVERFDLPKDIRTYAMHDGSLANVHFIGIAFNTPHFNAAKQVVDFMLSPQAQAQKKSISVWGDDTVLDMAVLTGEQQALFTSNQLHPSAIAPDSTTPLIAEPHSSWSDALREAWFARYGTRY